MSNQFVKNTDVPSPESILWKFADDWKVSAKTGQAYASLPGVERQDTYLHEHLSNLIKSGKIDDIEYESYFFVPTFFESRDPKKPKSKTVVSNWHVFAFESAQDSKKKVEELKKFANYTPKQPQIPPGVNTVPKPQQTLAPEYKAQYSPSAIQTGDSIPQYITTYTDPWEVDGNDQDTINKLKADGFSFIPRSILENTVWRETQYDAEGIMTGTITKFLMGRIINVRIAEK